MEVVDGIDGLPEGVALTVAVGMFDGLHRGHAHILETTVRVARERGSLATVITFEPHPAAVLRGDAPTLLCDPAELLARLAAAGVDIAVVQVFDRDFAAQGADEFLARISRGRQLRALVMTPESAFGRERSGTLRAVQALAPRLGFDVVAVPALVHGAQRISSTRIRAAIESGRLGDAARMLGHRYAVIGHVVHGDGRGRTLGYPTANLAFERPVTLPPNGIYAVLVSWAGPDPLRPEHRAQGVASLGVRPTFGGGQRLLEVYLLDFDGDLYGRDLRVELVRRQRGERRFPDVEALVRQMDRDVVRAREILGGTAILAAKSNAC